MNPKYEIVFQEVESVESDMQLNSDIEIVESVIDDMELLEHFLNDSTDGQSEYRTGT